MFVIHDQLFSGFPARATPAILRREPYRVLGAADPVPRRELVFSFAVAAPITESIFRPLMFAELRDWLTLFTSPANAPPLNWSCCLRCEIIGLALWALPMPGLPGLDVFETGISPDLVGRRKKTLVIGYSCSGSAPGLNNSSMAKAITVAAAISERGDFTTTRAVPSGCGSSSSFTILYPLYPLKIRPRTAETRSC
jgi:hypothetical protein